MQFSDGRRTYYDHEIPYQQILARGGSGWDAHSPQSSTGSYEAIHEFLNSPASAILGPGCHALDLGCGGGQVAMLLAQRGCITHGVDFSPSAINIAKFNAKKSALNIDFQEGDCLTLQNYSDGSFDFVADNHVWHCIVGDRDRRAFLQSIHRVLKPASIFFSETMTREGNFDPAAVHASPQTFIATALNRYWPTRDQVLSDLKSAGFEIFHDHLKSQPSSPGAGDLLVTYSRTI